MNKKELHALVYETKTGELRLVVVDDIGNIRFAGPVSAEYLPHMLNHPHEVESWKMPADIEDARKWWNATAATPGTELVYCRRPLWENMRNAARRAFGAVSPTPPELSAKYAGKKVIVMASPIKNKDARTCVIAAVKSDFEVVELGTVTCPTLALTLKNPDDLTRLITTIREAKNDCREYCRVVVVGCEVFPVR